MDKVAFNTFKTMLVDWLKWKFEIRKIILILSIRSNLVFDSLCRYSQVNCVPFLLNAPTYRVLLCLLLSLGFSWMTWRSFCNILVLLFLVSALSCSSHQAEYLGAGIVPFWALCNSLSLLVRGHNLKFFPAHPASYSFLESELLLPKPVSQLSKISGLFPLSDFSPGISTPRKSRAEDLSETLTHIFIPLSNSSTNGMW